MKKRIASFSFLFTLAFLQVAVAGIISIHNQTDVQNKRQQLIELIFGKQEVPQRLPDKIEKSVPDSDFVDLENLERIDKLTIEMEWGLKSIAYHFIPRKGNGELVIYHQGHRGHFVHGKEVINAFLKKGYAVIALAMPLKGLNSKPVVSHPHYGKLKISKHAHLSLLYPRSGHPVRYFLEPVIVVVNYGEQLKYRRISMIGISGGGWTTTLCAAIDTRIKNSYPVAGSLPFYLRLQDPKDSSWGDYEQWVAEVYQIANYPELYVLGGTGKSRRQLQVLNQYDSCCFSGTGYRTYEESVKERVQSLGEGHFSVWLDTTHHEHKISQSALEVIFHDLETR